MRTAGRRLTGFTLIEMIIVTTVIAVILALAIPNLIRARLSANESASLATLRTLWTGESLVRGSACIDLDGDGAGEYGFLREMAGLAGVRTSGDGSTVGRLLEPPRIPAAFRALDPDGAAHRTGYRFLVVLPDALGKGVHERPVGAFDGTVDVELSETMFGIYAWPERHSETGVRTFFLNQKGDIVCTDDPDYSGARFHTEAAAGVAFAGPGSVDSITGQVATGTLGRDGNAWRPVQ